MLQNGINPSLAMPAEKVTAWPSAMPTSNTLSGMAFIMMFIEHPVGMAGVTPTMRSLALARLKQGLAEHVLELRRRARLVGNDAFLGVYVEASGRMPHRGIFLRGGRIRGLSQCADVAAWALSCP